MNSSAYKKFIASMALDYEKWHDGIGYDLSALNEMNEAERGQVAALLRGRHDWRDAEALQALAALGDDSAAVAVAEIVDDDSPAPVEQQLYALLRMRDDGEIDDATLERRLLPALKVVEAYAGLTPALQLVQQVPTDRVKRRLLWGVIHHPEACVHYAAMLAYLCGKASCDFDWSLRPLFLRTKNECPRERHRAVEELCQLIGMEPSDAA
jgi:hypothetical protein